MGGLRSSSSSSSSSFSSREVCVGPLAVALALTALACAGCAGKVQDSELRALWVPRDQSRGLVIDEEESNMHRLYRPATADDKSARGDVD